MSRDRRAPPSSCRSCRLRLPRSSSAARIAGSQVVGGSALTSSVVMVTPRRAATSMHALLQRCRARCRGARGRCRECLSSACTREGMLLTAPGKTSQTPTVPTVSIAPVDLAAASSARISSAAAASASLRPGISLPPACPPSPSITMRWLAGAAMCVTRPTSRPSCSR